MMRSQLTPGLWRFGTPAEQRPGPTYVLAPFAGGSAYSVDEWTTHLLAEGGTVLALQYPGRGPRSTEPAARRMSEIVDVATEDLLRHSDGSLVLIGHSFGGRLGHEIALRLERAGRTIDLLVVSAARPPGLNRLSLAQIMAMDREAWQRELAGNGFGEEELLTKPDVLDLVIPALRADYLLLAKQRTAGGVVDCPMLAIGGSGDPWVSRAHLLAWHALTRGGCTTIRLPGGHFYYRDQLPAFARRVRRALADGTERMSADA